MQTYFINIGEPSGLDKLINMYIGSLQEKIVIWQMSMRKVGTSREQEMYTCTKQQAQQAKGVPLEVDYHENHVASEKREEGKEEEKEKEEGRREGEKKQDYLHL